ncbi:putative cytochrome P450 [Lindgomyces ingoldianus]|uniref:Cytochrome P450 n=1 Tax=Lindgomyces ingoldianus TaxID=673940 RepID=A0ACB6RG05_9PLEO|nr:putative cytochrome P450 [Lindgomyces ingoldianus]KAF2478184.1 putative cytochrome P450 [Lindgomyces ingoldianus]
MKSIPISIVKSEIGYSNFLYWIYPTILFLYYAYDLFLTKRIARKHSAHPLVGSPSSLAPRFLLNLIFASGAVRVIESGYRKFKTRTFQLIRGDGNVVVLPLEIVEELSTIPPNIASPHGALEHDLLGPYTGLNLILESRLHHSIVQRKLTPRLPALTPYLESELTSAIDEYFPTCEEWTEIQPFRLLGQVAARLTARALVGPGLCRNPVWLDISVNYTESLFKTIVILRLFPSWTHAFLSKLLPSYWAGRNYVSSAKALLGPKISSLLRKSDEGTWSPSESPDEYNVLAWLADLAKGTDRDANALAHVEVLLALASVHTTLLRMVNVLYDLAQHPEYFRELQDEIEDVRARRRDWDHSSYSQLQKLDSVLRESQRISPPTILGMKRLFKQDFTFANGLHIPKGTYVCMPTYTIENDPAHTPNPTTFDGFRSYRVRQALQDSQHQKEANEYQFSSFGKTVLNFGYGKAACPGRYFASLIIKMVFVKLLTEYEFKFLEGTERPKNLIVHEFLFPWPWDRILVRRKEEKGVCPF